MATIRERITDSANLPTLPAAAMYILKLADDDKTDLWAKLAATIEKDPALSLKVLRAVNSPFYGIPQKVSTVSQAVVLLGLHAVKAIRAWLHAAEQRQDQEDGVRSPGLLAAAGCTRPPRLALSEARR